jgi:hypothetical protein
MVSKLSIFTNSSLVVCKGINTTVHVTTDQKKGHGRIESNTESPMYFRRIRRHLLNLVFAIVRKSKQALAILVNLSGFPYLDMKLNLRQDLTIMKAMISALAM